MLEDAIGMESVVCATKSPVYSERLGYRPATAVPKRIPDRTFSGKSRTISDLRRVNLGVDTDELSPIWAPGIRRATDRIIRKKRQFPWVPVKECKRYVSNAFKRVLPRPDYVAIFCRQFDSAASGSEGDPARGWLARPVGVAAAPAISPCVRKRYSECAAVSMRLTVFVWGGPPFRVFGSYTTQYLSKPIAVPFSPKLWAIGEIPVETCSGRIVSTRPKRT